MNQRTNIDLFKDITLLYELSLSIGHSFNIGENISAFVKILMERKNIDMVSVWIKSAHIDDTTETRSSYSRIYSNPGFPNSVTLINEDHPLVKTFDSKESISVSYQSPDFWKFITEEGIHKGVYTVYKLGDLGFIKLYQYARRYAWDNIEQNKLLRVISQFTYSLKACLDHDLTVKETQKRIQVEQQLQKREKDFLEVINTIDDVFYAFDARKNRFVFLSPTFETMFGLDRDTVYADPSVFDRYTSTRDNDRTYTFTQDICSTQNSDREFTFSGSRGRKLSIWSKHKNIYDPQGRVERIVGTLRDISEKNRIMSQLEYRLVFEDLILDISSLFINLKAKNIDENINKTLQRIGQFVEADRSYIFFIHSNNKLMSNTYEWCADGVRPEIDNLQNLPVDTFPWWISKMQNFETINLYDINTLGEEAASARELLQSQSIKSLAVIPMILRNQLQGFIGFDFVRQHTHFSEDSIKMLRFVGQIVINAYDRKIQDERIYHQEQRYQNIIKSASDIIYRLDDTKRFIYMNERAHDIFGSSSTDINGMRFSDIVPLKYVENVSRYYDDQLANNVESTYLEFPVIDKNGEKIWIGQNTVLITGADGSKELTAMARDITEVIFSRESPKKAPNEPEKANRSKPRFDGNNSHEIQRLITELNNTPLNEEQKEILSMLSNTSRNLNDI